MEQKKIEMSVTKVIAARNAINRILSLERIPFRFSYWLGRNADALEPIEKRFRNNMQKRFEEEAEDVPITKHVPPDKYLEFKKELLEAVIKFSETSALIRSDSYLPSIFEKYEAEGSSGGKTLPPAKMMKFNLDATKDADQTIEEVSIFPIKITDEVASALKLAEEKLPGNVFVDVGIIFEGIED